MLHVVLRRIYLEYVDAEDAIIYLEILILHAATVPLYGSITWL